MRLYKRDKRLTQYNKDEKTRVITTAFTAIYTSKQEEVAFGDDEDIQVV